MTHLGDCFIYKTKRSRLRILPGGINTKYTREATICLNTLRFGGQVGPKPHPKISCDSIFPEFAQKFIAWY